MATTPFTLAALATSAVPGLEVTGTRDHSSHSGGAFTSAVLLSNQGELIVRIPQHETAEVQQSAELLGRAALMEGARKRLPFQVPSTLGVTRAGDTRAVVSTFIDGELADTHELAHDHELLRDVAAGIAAIHGLPTRVVRAAGLPVRAAEDCRAAAARVVERAVSTGLLPVTVKRRWDEVLGASEVWSFDPVVIHGSLDAELLVVGGSQLLGVLGWSELAIGDPALDLAWVLEAGEEVFAEALSDYVAASGAVNRRTFSARARFYHELEVARWLLHGVESHQQQVIDDAVAMLDRLVDRLSLLGEVLPRERALNEHEVEQMLEQTPDIEHDPRSETAEYESLDEDRAFTQEYEFVERDSAQDGQESGGAEGTRNVDAEHDLGTGQAADTGKPSDTGEPSADTGQSPSEAGVRSKE